ncbi:GNAT family N-acetyltransferase [Solibacillus daqui]|uniref:GNAT family N-acetyltransferase n=1 Tax=Solibacillus daqui TaxID=2912187 RepID=UPI0023650221|nr:GNAT family N-acetyltransferase [Solibacillus daqui]
MIIRNYTEKDEQGWLRCRILSFLNTAYFDNVLQLKETYKNAAIELVAEIDGQIVGLIDVEYEATPKTVCTQQDSIGGMIWHIAVHPDFQRQGIGEALLHAVQQQAMKLHIEYFEAWTRDDPCVQNWYEKNDFEKTSSYYHVYLEGNEMKNLMNASVDQLYPVTAFAHYTGKSLELFQHVKRKHECVCYVKVINQ